jgi:dolichol-phosphate hexosyltransferase
MPSKIHTSIIIPTLNEASSIGKVIDDIPKNSGTEILVVDGLSIDRTVEVARKHGARIVLCKEKGKGIAMVRGAESAKGQIIAYIDGDDTYEAYQLNRFIELVKNQKYDMVVGRRIIEKGAMTFTHKIGNFIISVTASILHGRVQDILSGMRVLRKDSMLALGLKSRGFGIETELYVKARKMKFHIQEIPVRYTARVGQSKLSGWNDGVKILWIIVRSFFSDRAIND